MKSQIKKLLQQYNLTPNKLMGQNFLIDETVLQKIIETAELAKNDTVLEIGPGLGILTEELAKNSGKVIAVEKDKNLATILKNNLKKYENLEIIESDILKWEKLSALQNYKVVANIPFYLTARLIRILMEIENKPERIILMIQKEVAARICAAPPKMSLLSYSVQFYAKPQIISFVSKKSFWPEPKIDSAILKIIPQKTPPIISPDIFFTVLKAGFSQPRKQLANNLAKSLKIERQKIETILKQNGINPEQRAETLSIEDWINLSQNLF